MARFVADGALAAALLFAAPCGLGAQTPVPVEQEPRHHVVYSNTRIRVIDAALPAGYASLYHTHARDNVPIVVGAGRIAVQLLGAAATEQDAALGRATFARASYAHRVSNVGGTTVRFIDVELVGAPPARGERTSAAASEPRGHRLELENDRVRIHRVTLPAGDSLPAHRHAGAVVAVVVRAPGARSAGGSPGRALEPGRFDWYADGRVPRAANAGALPLEVVEVELK
jgi:quercetin dioxygenase-like cupin family protein